MYGHDHEYRIEIKVALEFPRMLLKSHDDAR